MALRKGNRQVSVTIPLRMAVAGGFDKAKYVVFSQQKNGSLKLRRLDIGKNNQE